MSEYGVILIGHNKLKGITKENGDEYQVVTSDLFSNYYGGFSKKATIICNLIEETDVEDGQLVDSQRMMHFRSNNFVKAGTRLKNIQEKAPFGADNYIKVVKDALKDSVNNSFEIKNDDFDEVDNTEALHFSLDEYIEKINDTVDKLLEKDDDANSKIMEVLDDNDVTNPNKIEDLELAKKVSDELEELLS